MPKKFGSNTKATEARERKDASKLVEQAKKDKEIEDALWKDEDKHTARKQQRKQEKEKKKLEVLDKKLTNKLVYEEEMSCLKSAKPAPTKVTRAEIASNAEKIAVKPQKNSQVEEVILEENLNRLVVEGDVARSIDEAISVLSSKVEKSDLHPEKRIKAAYLAFEEKYLPALKAENPNLRLSQLKQMLKKDWSKSPENPLNQR